MTQDIGMLTASASIKATTTTPVDRSTPWDQPGDWQRRRIAHLEGALRLLNRALDEQATSSTRNPE